jgi:hypothetical protein
VNLLTRTDASTHRIQGEWSKGEGLKVGSASSARLGLSYHPGKEYDFRVSFTRHTGVHSVAIIFAAGGKQAAFEIDAWGQHLAGMQNVGGRDIRQNASRVNDQALANGQKYTAIVRVRKDSIIALLNGRELTRIKSDGSDLSLSDFWRLPDTAAIGVGAWRSETTFHSIEVRPVTGEGEFITTKQKPATATARTERPPRTGTRPQTPTERPPSKTQTTTAARPASPKGKGKGRVLMVIANDGFFYREYGDPRRELESAGFTVDVAAGFKSRCVPHRCSRHGPDGGIVQPDYAITQVKADNYVAIVFSGGWGSSMYQYAFKGNYSHGAYNGNREIKEAANKLINDHMPRTKAAYTDQIGDTPVSKGIKLGDDRFECDA